MPDEILQALPGPLLEVLRHRGVPDSELDARFSWNPTELRDRILSATGEQGIRGFDAAVAAMLSAREKGETVVVHGDYDVDGMTGTAILWLALRRSGIHCGWTLPRRDGEGYGLSDASLERCQRTEDVFGLPEDAPHEASWVVSVDTGITACAQIARAKERGLKVLLTDHHLPGEEFPVAAEVVLDPHQPDCAYPNKGLCGAALAWKLGAAVLRAVGMDSESDPERLLQLVALGTLADMVPLTLENLALVRMGLVELKERPLPGIAELLKSAQVSTNSVPKGQELVFRVTPRLNSAGRLRKGEVAVRLMLAANQDEAHRMMEGLESLNQERQALDQRITAEALTQCKHLFSDDGVAPNAFLLSGETWHEGVSGIVAQRVAEKYGRPALVLAPDPGQPLEWRGSGRSVPGIDLHAALARCSHLMEKWGGHSQAAGLSLRKDRTAEFRLAFEAAVADARAAAAPKPVAGEARADFTDLSPELLGWIERLGPWGPTNQAPVFWTDSVQIAGMSRVGEGKHLRLSLRQGDIQLDGIGFGMGELAKTLVVGQSVRVAFHPEWNDFRGRRNIQIKIKEIQ